MFYLRIFNVLTNPFLLMKNFLFLLAVSLLIAVTAQNTYLHCGKIIDTKNGTVLTNKTIVVKGYKIVAVNDGFSIANQN